jgi:hypothetical protein
MLREHGSEVTMSSAGSGSGHVAQRVRRFAVIGAVIGVVLYLIKVASDDFDVAGDWPWLVLIFLGGFAGAGIGLVLAGVGQSDQVD